MISTRTHIYPLTTATAEAAAVQIMALLEAALLTQQTATLAVSGGSTPKLMFQAMAERSFDWTRVHLFFVDERAVPPSSPQSNYKLAQDHFIAPAGFPDANVHRVMAELDPDPAAERYAAEIREFFQGDEPRFDVIHQGIGPDCHTASLFPGEPSIEDRGDLVRAVWVEKMKQFRVTMLPRILLSADRTVLLVTGEDKAEAVRTIVDGPYDPLRYPAQLVARHAESVEWFLDASAAALIQP